MLLILFYLIDTFKTKHFLWNEQMVNLFYFITSLCWYQIVYLLELKGEIIINYNFHSHKQIKP